MSKHQLLVGKIVSHVVSHLLLILLVALFHIEWESICSCRLIAGHFRFFAFEVPVLDHKCDAGQNDTNENDDEDTTLIKGKEIINA